MKQDREAIRILVADIGYTEAAKRTGIKYGTLRQWAARGKWHLTPTHHKVAKAVTNVTTSPAEAHAQALAEDSNASKIGFSRAARKVAEHAANLKPRGIYKRARAIKDIAAVAGQVHGWNNEMKQPGILNVKVLAGQAAVQINATDRSSAPE